MLSSIRTFLGTEVDNSPLVLFRMIYGFLLAMESFGAIVTGWVRETLINPEFTFTIIGFEWLQPLDGNGMILYFVIMGIAALGIMLGLFYRTSVFIFFSMWTLVYMMQKTHYNNHYYLLILMSAVMLIFPAHKSGSLDVKWGLTRPSKTCLRVCHWFFILQILVIYVYASIHKINPDWLNARPLSIWFDYKSDYWLIGSLLQKEWFPYLIAWGGVIYDSSIVFLLLHPKTRKVGFILSVFFNLFNSWVFQIGIFPYLMIGLTVFFFPPEIIRKMFFNFRPKIYPVENQLSKGWTLVLCIYFLFQVLLPLRHHLFKGDVAFTEEGHRLAWRMMLRTKSGTIDIYVKNLETNERKRINLNEYLTPDQKSSLPAQPDMIWQFAQRLKRQYALKGEEIAVFADAKVSLNGHPRRSLIDASVNLAEVDWEPFKHADWILTNEEDNQSEK